MPDLPDLRDHPHVFPGLFSDLLELGNQFTQNEWRAMAQQAAQSSIWVVTDDEERISLVGGFYPVDAMRHACWIVTNNTMRNRQRSCLVAFRALARALPAIAPAGRLFMAVKTGHKPGLGIARILGFQEVPSVLQGHHTLIRDMPFD